MIKVLTKNLGLKIASIVLACILWFVIAQIGNPRDTKSFSNIPVTIINTELLDAENKVYEVLDNTDEVRVTVTAPVSILSNIRTSDIIAEADVSKLTDINTIAIRYSIQNADVDAGSISGDHDVVRLNVEEKSTKWIRVVHETVGEVAEGYVVYSATPDQTMIEVSGPKSVISQVGYAKIQLDVTGATANMSANLLVELYDKENNLLEHKSIKKNTDQIHMNVEILATKDIGVKVNVGGAPAEGYALTGETHSSITKLKVAGTKYALMSLNQVTIPAEAVDATGKEGTFTVTVNLRDYLPGNIRIADTNTSTEADIEVVVEQIAEKSISIPIQQIGVQGVPEEKKLELPVDVTEVTCQILGLQRDLEQVTAETVTAYIDIAAWMKDKKMKTLNDGSYEVPLTVVTENDKVTLKEQYTLKVKVSKL